MKWNPFRKKKKDQKRNLVDDLANSLQDEERVEELEFELLELNLEGLNEKEKLSWYHLYGICAFQTGNHIEAIARFSKGLIECPDSSEIRFSLGQEYIYIGQPGKAFQLFDECEFPKISREFTLAMSRYAYIFAEYERGANYLNGIFDYYKELKILDDHFLYVRGLPFFGIAWAYLAAHRILAGNVNELQHTTQEIKRISFDYDFRVIDHMFEYLIGENCSNLLSTLYEQREELGKYNIPTGENDLRIAIFESFSGATYQEAITKIDGVKLGEKDASWLADIRLLAKAQAANRFKEIQAENKIIDTFLKHQPMLFEPDHAVYFGLLKYQELLKPQIAIGGS